LKIPEFERESFEKIEENFFASKMKKSSEKIYKKLLHSKIKKRKEKSTVTRGARRHRRRRAPGEVPHHRRGRGSASLLPRRSRSKLTGKSGAAPPQPYHAAAAHAPHQLCCAVQRYSSPGSAPPPFTSLLPAVRSERGKR
jgi:hypothetical protein